MRDLGTWLYLGEWVLKLVVAARLLLRRDLRDVSRLAWLVVVLAEPLIGCGVYALIGERHLGSLRARRYREVIALQGRVDAGQPSETPAGCGEIADLVTRLGGRPARGGNRLEFFANSERFADRLIGDLQSAAHSCHLLFYIYLEDATGRRVAAALLEAAARGVACRVLVDSIGSRDFANSELADRLREGGVEVRESLPAGLFRAFLARVDLRNHRKICVLDGRIAYTGSQNLAHSSFARKPDFAPWHDVMLRIEGPAVRDLGGVFLSDWFLDSGEDLRAMLPTEPERFEPGSSVQVLASGPDTKYAELAELNQFLIHHARRRLVLTTPYFVPDASDLLAIRNAVRRGVRVQIVVPKRPDSRLADLASRSLFGPLLEAGVEIHVFPEGLLHAKTLSIDEDLAVVTTANFDRRSFELNLETTTLVYDREFCAELIAVQENYMSRSEQLDPKRYRHRPWWRRMLENAAGMFGPLL